MQVAATMGITVQEINSGSKSYEMLKQAAKDAGATTKFSATQSAEALNYLALAGYDAEKSVKALPTVLNLAAAGGLDLGYASDLVTDSMSALGLETDQLEGFVDQLAKTSQKSNTSVAQLGEAILTVGGTAKVLKGGTVELNTALGILADNGIKGAEGGTALRNVILSLSAPTDKAAATLKELGIQVLDAQGNMRPLNETFGDLNSKLSTMSQGEQTQVLNKIFNKVDLKAVNALLANSGERFDQLSGAINQSTGAAANMAETMNDNLKGKITILGSSLEGLGIQIYEKMEKPLKKGVETAIEAVGTLADRLSDGDLSGSVDRLAENFGNLVGTLAELAVKVLPIVIDGLNLLIENGNTIATIFVSATAAVAAFKVVAFIKDVVDVWKKASAVATSYKLAVEACEGVELLLASTMSAREVIVAVLTGNMTLATAATTLWTMATEALSAAMAFVGGPIGLIVIAISALVAGIIYLWNTNDDFRNAVIGAWEAIKTGFMECWNAIGAFFTETIPGWIEGLKEWFAGLPEWFAELGENIKQFFIEKWNDIWNFFTETIPTWIEGIVNWFMELPGKIGYALGYVLGAIVKWGIDSWNYLVTNVPLWIEGIGNWFKELPGRIWEWLKESWNKLSTWGTEMWSKAQEICSKFLSDVVDWFKKLPGRIWEWLVNSYHKVVSWGSDLWNAACDAGKELVDGMIDTVKSLPDKMLDIGKDIVRGLWEGIKSMGSWLWDGVTGFVGGIVDGFKAGLGIHSPSRVMKKEVGKWIPPGISEGIEDEMPNLQRDINANISDLTSKMQMTVNYETAHTAAKITSRSNDEIIKSNSMIKNNDEKVPVKITLINKNYLDSEEIAESTTPIVIENINESQRDYIIAQGGMA